MEYDLKQQHQNFQVSVCVKVSQAKWPITELIFLLQGPLIIAAWICLVIVFTQNDNGGRLVFFYSVLPFLLGFLTTLAGALAVCLRCRDSSESMHEKREVHISIVVWVLVVFVINTISQLAAVQNLKIEFNAAEIITIIFTTLYLITVVCLLVLAILQKYFVSGTSKQDRNAIFEPIKNPMIK